jgi:outer membrane lipoprotein SlyB
MRMHWLVSVVILGLLAGCAGSQSRHVYSRSDAGRPWTVQDAVVVQVVEATIDGRESAIGTFGGGFVGHAAGSAVGAGAGSSIAGAVGAVVGAVAGRKAEREMTQQKAWEIIVELEQGAEQIAIVQPADESFEEGERVRVYTRSDGAARVAKL